ncbi:MAG TPA: hypothetical protein DEQ14_06900 [Treponema sp.]|nr:hypothetical protein [Treponema sp.]
MKQSVNTTCPCAESGICNLPADERTLEACRDCPANVTVPIPAPVAEPNPAPTPVPVAIVADMVDTNVDNDVDTKEVWDFLKNILQILIGLFFKS